MVPEIHNILANLPPALSGEAFEAIAGSDSVRIERIVSRGQATPEGEWYEQEAGRMGPGPGRQRRPAL